MIEYEPIAQTNHFIVLDKYNREWQVAESYQGENDLEQELINDLASQGYQYLPGLNTAQAMLANVGVQLETLNAVTFSEGEWLRFVETKNEPAEPAVSDQEARRFSKNCGVCGEVQGRGWGGLSVVCGRSGDGG